MAGLWILLMWAAWWLVFTADAASVVQSTTERSAGTWERAYYVGFSFFTLGLGDYVPRNDLWRILTALASFTGLFFVTLSITYFTPVLSAATQKRQLSAILRDLGDTPEDVLLEHWDGEGFDQLISRLDNVLWDQLHLYSQSHLAYPILHRFYDADPGNSFAVRISVLSEALTLLSEHVAPPARPGLHKLLVTIRAIDSLLDVLEQEFIEPNDQEPPAIEVHKLLSSDIPLRDEPVSLDEQEKSRRRKRLLALVHDAGAQWNMVNPNAPG